MVYFKRYDAPVDSYATLQVTDAAARSTVIADLNAGTQYSFHVKCYNSHGSSPSSNSVVKQTLGNGYHADALEKEQALVTQIKMNI